MARAAQLVEFLGNRVLGIFIAGLVFLDQFDRSFRRVRIDAELELVEDRLGPTSDFLVLAEQRFLQGRFGRLAGCPQKSRGLLAPPKTGGSKLLDGPGIVGGSRG